ncbi:MAG: diacylglycerol kinase family protein [Pirellulales bacterium]
MQQPLQRERLARSADHVIVAFNPRAGSRARAEKIQHTVDRLTGAGLTVEVLSDLDSVARSAAEQFASGRLRALVSAGGDGTAAELLNRTPPGVPLCPLPLGTENLIAKHFGLTSVEVVVRAIIEGNVLRLDAGRAGGRLFLLMISCGFDAEVICLVHKRRTGHIWRGAYVWPILNVIRTFRYPPLIVSLENHGGAEPTQLITPWIQAFNVPRYAFGFQFCPTGEACDGLLETITYAGCGFWNMLRYYGCARLNFSNWIGDRRVQLARRFSIHCDAPEPVPYQLDGDFGGYLPVEVDVVPERLTLVVPPAP